MHLHHKSLDTSCRASVPEQVVHREAATNEHFGWSWHHFFSYFFTLLKADERTRL